MWIKESLRTAVTDLFQKHLQDVQHHYPDLMNALKEKPFLATDTGVHPKLMADWNRKGMLLSPHEKNKRHSFSLTELVWIKLVEKMRSYNFSQELIMAFRNEMVMEETVDLKAFLADPTFIESILASLPEEARPAVRQGLSDPKTLKDFLAFFSKEIDAINKLEAIVLLGLIIRHPVSFLIDHHGEGTLFSPFLLDEPDIDLKEFYHMLCKSHVTLSVTEVLANALVIPPIEKVSGRLQFITDQEARVLQALEEKDVVSVTVRIGRKGTLDLLEITKLESIDKRARLMEVLLSNAYQDVTITTAKGHIVNCKNTRKVKLK